MRGAAGNHRRRATCPSLPAQRSLLIGPSTPGHCTRTEQARLRLVGLLRPYRHRIPKAVDHPSACPAAHWSGSRSSTLTGSLRCPPLPSSTKRYHCSSGLRSSGCSWSCWFWSTVLSSRWSTATACAGFCAESRTCPREWRVQESQAPTIRSVADRRLTRSDQARQAMYSRTGPCPCAAQKKDDEFGKLRTGPAAGSVPSPAALLPGTALSLRSSTSRTRRLSLSD